MSHIPNFHLDSVQTPGFDIEDIELFRQSWVRTQQISRYGPLIPTEDFSRYIAIVTEGWAGQIDDTGDRRQIADFIIPGDLSGLEEMMLGLASMEVRALTAATVEYFDASTIKSLLAEHPQFAESLLRYSLLQSVTARARQSRLRMRSASQRLGWLIQDLVLRICRSSRKTPNEVVIPLTQFDLADATALTAIHVNRVLGELRSKRVISIDKRELRVLNWAALLAITGTPHDTDWCGQSSGGPWRQLGHTPTNCRIAAARQSELASKRDATGRFQPR